MKSPEVKVKLKELNIKDGENIEVFLHSEKGIVQIELRVVDGKPEIFLDETEFISSFQWWYPYKKGVKK